MNMAEYLLSTSESPLPLEPPASEPLYKIVEFDKFKELVASSLPPFFYRSHNQIEAIYDFLSTRPRRCLSMIVERHYIDRAFMDEYKEFYGTSFKHYPNFCDRLHFFYLSKSKLEEQLKTVIDEIAKKDTNRKKYDRLCREFSENAYLGFMVVKPLPNTRIGRTVIRHPQEETDSLVFPCTRVYTAHILGLELSVCGLPFQQQDGGMSACASTATWASLSHFAEFEHFQAPSPAALTKFAATQITRFGRSIPQENGLTIDQICKAIEAANLAPYLISFNTAKRARTIQAHLYSSIKAGFAPILIIKNAESQHAVSVGGMLLAKDSPYKKMGSFRLRDKSDRLRSIFVNDDRLGPYQVADFKGSRGIVIQGPKGPDPWEITHLLIPHHQKIRFSFTSLYELALDVAWEVGMFFLLTKPVTTETWIMKSRSYRQHALFGKNQLSPETSGKLNSLINFSRYIGIARLSDASFGMIDVIVDTTNTSRHTNVLLVLGRQIKTTQATQLVKDLADKLGSPYLIDQ
jgi:hypothetical protein